MLSPPELEPVVGRAWGVLSGCATTLGPRSRPWRCALGFSGITHTRRSRCALLRADMGVPESSGCESSVPVVGAVVAVPELLGRLTATCTAWLPFTGPVGLALQPASEA